MTEHSQRSHAKLAPSAAHRWMSCPGSVRLCAGIEEAPSMFAAEGTAAHQLAEKCLRGGFDAARFKGDAIEIEGQKFTVDHEMVASVQIYLDIAREIEAESDEFEIETRMDMSHLVPGVFGTGDMVAYNGAERRVTVCDFKYGRGVAVEAAENEQLLTYVVGVAQRYHNRGVDQVELIVVQPRAPHRAGPVRYWRTDLVGLFEHITALQSAAELASKPDAPLVPGDHCRFCKARAICPALNAKVMEIIGAETKNGVIVKMSDPTKYTPEQLATALKNLPIVMAWSKGVEQFGHAEGIRGRVPPGFKMVAKRAVRKWQDEREAIDTLRLAGVSDDDLFETSLRSPAQIEKALPKKDRNIIEELSVKQSTGTVLAPIDDARPAVDPNDNSGFTAMEIGE